MAKDLHAAVLALQGEIGTLQKNALNPHFGNKYISLDALVEQVQPLLTKHGLIWNCSPSHYDGTPVLVYALTHVESGDSMGAEMPLLLEKQNAQGLGSAITYARRYALCAVLNIVADVDDDGEKAAKQKPAAKEEDFASKVRATKMKGPEVRAWLQTEGGYSLEDLGPAGELAKFLNGLDQLTQKKLLAWANG